MVRENPFKEMTAQVAVVGSGPAGCYLAQALLKSAPKLEIAMIDQLSTPFGLVRYGIAPDHQGTKTVDRQFARLFEKQGVEFIGGVRVGEDVSLDQLREAFDAVVVATGLHADAQLAIQGSDLAGVYGAGRITRLLNGHPHEEDVPESLGEVVGIVGMGNVAIDLVRLLAKTEADLDGSDIVDAVHAELASEVHEIHVLSRSTVGASKFDSVMVAELLELEGLEHHIHGIDASTLSPDNSREEVIRQLIEHEVTQPRVRIHWWFESAPVRVEGGARVTSMTIRSAEREVTVPVSAVVTAIGFGAGERPALVQVDEDARASGRVDSGLYAAGWVRTGPRGALPDQRSQARELAERILHDLLEDAESRAGQGVAALHGLGIATATTYADWQAIDRHEQAIAPPERVRRKITSAAELEEVIAQARAGI